MNTFVHAASHYAIFTTQVRPGERGYALLTSLILNMNDRDACRDMLALHRAGVVELIRREDLDFSCISHELRERGVSRDVLDRSDLYDGQCTYAALRVMAGKTTADTVRDRTIHCMHNWLSDRWDVAAKQLRLACAIALGAKEDGLSRKDAREICAQHWNRYAGVVC